MILWSEDSTAGGAAFKGCNTRNVREPTTALAPGDWFKASLDYMGEFPASLG